MAVLRVAWCMVHTSGAPIKIGRCPVGRSDKRLHRHPYDRKKDKYCQAFKCEFVLFFVSSGERCTIFPRFLSLKCDKIGLKVNLSREETFLARPLNPKLICQACLLHFNGDLFKDIAILLDVHPNTLTKWRKTQIWKDFEAQLIAELPKEMGANAKTEN